VESVPDQHILCTSHGQGVRVFSWFANVDAIYSQGAFRLVEPLASGRFGAEIHDAPMLLDTASDVALLPRSHVAALVLPDAKQLYL
jgi:hypothetical protein